LIDLQNSFTAANSSKFPTKPILGYIPHLKYVAALPWKTYKSEICNSHARKKRLKRDFLSSIQQIKEIPNVVKISAKINTMQNYQHFTFCSFTVLYKLKALQLSKIDLQTIKHQYSKKLTRWIEAT